MKETEDVLDFKTKMEGCIYCQMNFLTDHSP